MSAQVYTLWLKALRFEAKSHGRGFQAELARRVGLSPVHLNDILAGRRQASLMLQERIAESLGYRYEEMVAFGRGLSDSGSWMGQLEKILEMPRTGRLPALIQLAEKTAGKDVTVGQTLKELYQTGRLTEREMLSLLLEQTGYSVETARHVRGKRSYS